MPPTGAAAVLGITEFGRGFMVGKMVTQAAREGARLASIGDSSNSEVTLRVEDSLATQLGVQRGNVTVQIRVTPAPGHEMTGHNVLQAQARDLITVSVSVPFDKVSYVAGNYLKGKMLSGRCAMWHE